MCEPTVATKKQKAYNEKKSLQQDVSMLSTCSELACPPESMVQKQWQQQNVVGKKKGLKKGSNTKLKTAKLQIESSRKIVEASLRLTDTAWRCGGI